MDSSLLENLYITDPTDYCDVPALDIPLISDEDLLGELIRDMQSCPNQIPVLFGFDQLRLMASIANEDIFVLDSLVMQNVSKVAMEFDLDLDDMFSAPAFAPYRLFDTSGVPIYEKVFGYTKWNDRFYALLLKSEGFELLQINGLGTEIDEEDCASFAGRLSGWYREVFISDCNRNCDVPIITPTCIQPVPDPSLVLLAIYMQTIFSWENDETRALIALGRIAVLGKLLIKLGFVKQEQAICTMEVADGNSWAEIACRTTYHMSQEWMDRVKGKAPSRPIATRIASYCLGGQPVNSSLLAGFITKFEVIGDDARKGSAKLSFCKQSITKLSQQMNAIILADTNVKTRVREDGIWVNKVLEEKPESERMFTKQTVFSGIRHVMEIGLTEVGKALTEVTLGIDSLDKLATLAITPTRRAVHLIMFQTVLEMGALNDDEMSAQLFLRRVPLRKNTRDYYLKVASNNHLLTRCADFTMLYGREQVSWNTRCVRLGQPISPIEVDNHAPKSASECVVNQIKTVFESHTPYTLAELSLLVHRPLFEVERAVQKLTQRLETGFSYLCKVDMYYFRMPEEGPMTLKDFHQQCTRGFISDEDIALGYIAPPGIVEKYFYEGVFHSNITKRCIDEKIHVQMAESLILDAGKGLFAKTNIPKGTYLHINGRHLENDAFPEEEFFPYGFSYTSKSGKHMIINTMSIFDGVTCAAGYVNDAKGFSKPNLDLIEIAGLDDLYYVTIRPIAAGEELFWDYGREYWEAMDLSPKKTSREWSRYYQSDLPPMFPTLDNLPEAVASV